MVLSVQIYFPLVEPKFIVNQAAKKLENIQLSLRNWTKMKLSKCCPNSHLLFYK